MADSNSLGLDFEKETATAETTTDQAQNAPENETKPEKKKPYVNPERVKTGGPQRVRAVLVVYARSTDDCTQEKPSEEELAERMQRIKEQNEKIKQRRLVSARPSFSLTVPLRDSRMSKRTRMHSERRKTQNASSRRRRAKCRMVSIAHENRTHGGSWTGCRAVNGTRASPREDGNRPRRTSQNSREGNRHAGVGVVDREDVVAVGVVAALCPSTMHPTASQRRRQRKRQSSVHV